MLENCLWDGSVEGKAAREDFVHAVAQAICRADYYRNQLVDAQELYASGELTKEEYEEEKRRCLGRADL